MSAFNQAIGYPLGWIMWALYAVVKNYGVALFIFTLIIKLVTFPLTLKQQKSTGKMSMLQPQIAEIQKKYKDNKEKINEETMALYQKEGYNPMSGCVPMLIPMVLLFGMIDVIYSPLKHILRIPQEIIDKGIAVLGEVSAMSGMQLELIRNIKSNPSAFTVMGSDIVQKIQELNFNFLWMDLTQQPSFSMFGEIFSNFNPILLIPLFSGLSALASSIQVSRTSAQQTAGAMKGMMYVMPFFSTWIAFSVPAGVGLYWCFSNLLQIGQTVIMNKIYNPREMMEKAKKEMEERQEQERLERIEAKKKLREAARESVNAIESKLTDEEASKALTQKDINRKKLTEARKRDAEKYGETYVEVTDEDLK